MSLHLGLDLGGTNIKVTAISVRDDRDPKVVHSTEMTSEAFGGPAHVTQRLLDAARVMIDDVGPVASIGVGVPGLFRPDVGEIVLFPNLPGPWEGYGLRGPIEEALGVPATLINDGNAFVLAEGTIGAGRGHNTVIGVTLGTGIGGGIMTHGRVLVGAFGTGGEIGHQIVEPDGPLCGCGNRGCVEPLAMASTLAAIAEREDPIEIYTLAAEGDQVCIKAVNQVTNYLGIGLANVIALVGPSCIVVGGGIASAGEVVLGPIRDAVRRHVTLTPMDEIEIVQAELGSLAGSLGAGLAGVGQVDVRAK